MTLDQLFRRYGSPFPEANESIHIYFTRADKIESLEKVQSSDKRAAEKIAELLDMAEILKEYRKTLFDRARELYSASYTMQLSIKRDIDIWKNKKFYIVEIRKIFDTPNTNPGILVSEKYEGKERFKALKRFEELKKQYPGIETEQDTDKKTWER